MIGGRSLLVFKVKDEGQTFMVNFRGAKEDRNNTNKARIFKHHMHNGIVNVSVVCSTPCGKKSTKDNRRT